MKVRNTVLSRIKEKRRMRYFSRAENAWRSEVERLRAALRLIRLVDDRAHTESMIRAALREVE